MPEDMLFFRRNINSYKTKHPHTKKEIILKDYVVCLKSGGKIYSGSGTSGYLEAIGSIVFPYKKEFGIENLISTKKTSWKGSTTYYVHLKDSPEICGKGRNIYVAVGKMIKDNPEHFNLEKLERKI